MLLFSVIMGLLAAPEAAHASARTSHFSVRAVMIHPRSVHEMDFYRDLIRVAARSGFNTVIIESTGWVNYKLFRARLPNGFSEGDISALVSYARSLKLEVIPYVVLLTHQQEVAKRFAPQLLLNETTLDVSNPSTWIFEKYLINTYINLFHPRMMLIGQDELWGYPDGSVTRSAIAEGAKRLSPVQYVSHIIAVHNYLAARNIRTIIWGDMFVTPVYAPRNSEGELKTHTGCHGTDKFVSLLSKLPKDIVIADWHYENNATDYPSYDFFKSYGFEVWGATWHEKNNIESFPRYILGRAGHGEGMIATTWQFCAEKYRDYVMNFVSLSGKAYAQ